MRRKKLIVWLIISALAATLIPGVVFGTAISSAAASSTTGSFVAGNAIDGNTGNFYSSAGHTSANNTEWLQVDLGSKQYSINLVRVTPRPNGYGFPVNYTIQYSDDASTWTDVPGASFVNFSNPGGKEVVIPFSIPVNGRYIRLYATTLSADDFGTYYLQIAELKVDQQYVATASSVTGSLVAGNAVDGNTNGNSFYSSANHASSSATEWLQLDLGAVKNGIQLIRLTPRQLGYGFPKDFKIQYSNDASTWTDVPGASFTNYDSSSGAQVVIPFSSPVNARYVRVYATKLGQDDGGAYYFQINEAAVETASSQAIAASSVTATSNLTGWEPSHITDNNTGTVWSSNSHGTNPIGTEGFTITYSQKYAISKLVLTPRSGGLAFPVDFKLQYSQDGSTFTDIPGQNYTSFSNPGSASVTLSFDPVFAKAIKLTATKLGPDDFGNYYFQLAEATAYLWDTYSDTWSATDNLGRSLPAYSSSSSARSDKFVGMFYFLWLGAHGTNGPYDIQQIIANNTNAMSNPNSPPWGAYGDFHHWGQSQFGYYLSTDRYVIRKNAQLLSDAGVDTLIFDVTNGFTYKDQYTALLEEYTDIRNAGGKTPQIVFLCPFGDPTAVVNTLYTDLYGAGLYSDLWFRWDNNKPLILADPAYFTNNPTISNFFTFRKPMPDYVAGPSGTNQWGWLENYPQHGFSSSSVTNEEVTVGVAQNSVPNGSGGWTLGSMSQPGARGRSFHAGSEPSAPYPTDYGYNFAEEWGRALDIDPKFVFITGWNEWVASRFNSFAGYSADNIFVDEFNQEFSRDIEPMLGGHGDNYYYQLVDYIRRYKGIRQPQNADSAKTITIDGSFADWSSIGQEFRDDIGDQASRNDLGWGSAGTYTNTTGRNDFEIMKVARDSSNIYFYVKTKDNISSYTGDNWMRLFIKTAGSTHDWDGYDYVVNRQAGSARTSTATTLEQATGTNSWSWSTVSSSIAYRVNGREMELAIPRSSLGLSDTTIPLSFEFKWNDNMQTQGDTAEFMINGDTAPNSRFNYKFTEVAQ